MTELAYRIVRPIRLRRFVVGLLLLLLVAGAAVGAMAGRAYLHDGEVLPGVRVLGIGLTGLSEEEAGLRIRALVAARLAEPAPLSVAGERVEIAPNRLFTLDRTASAQAALDAGRGVWPDRARTLLSPLAAGVDVEPVLVVRPQADERILALLRRFATPPVSASVVLDGLEPTVKPGKPGTRPDVGALLAALETRIVSGAPTAVPVSLIPAPPAVEEAAAAAAAAEVRLALSAPVALSFQGDSLGELAPERLAKLLTFAEQGDRLVVLFDEERLAKALAPRMAPYRTKAKNAQFAVEGGRVRLIPAQAGTTLDARAAAIAVNTAAHRSEERIASLSLQPLAAERTTREARALGITERISTFTTEMGPSSANRIHNVHLMANYIDGTIIAPGDAFSFNERVGPRTAERGFREGQMIVGSLLLPSIGGGVCQTATTLFNNAWELGLPIVERHNHSFYISHYPLGRDATVSWGGPDFKFRNDMEHAILIKTSYTDATLTFSFYGTDEGRKVTTWAGEKSNWRTPKLTYALDPAAPRGSVRVQRGDYQQGFDVTAYRKVERDGKVLRKDSVTSSYIPVGDTAIYGPGRSIPGSYFVIPTT
ncbi:MAG: VanW family protein [Actinomycetota bacterium]|nr:VanW family protein [Actinomycetota bacterium]